MENKPIYMNNAQIECFHVAAHTSVVVAGRRFGKTHGVVAPWLLRNVQAMPGSAGGIIGATFQQLLTRTLPGTLEGLEMLGYKRNLHYVVGIRPPKELGFSRPRREPISYDRVVSWYNGSVWYLISQDVPGSSNSLTLQYLLGDEAKFLNFEKLKDETFPANGGFPGPWADCPWLNSMLFCSDMPSTKKGSWFLNYESLATPEAIDAIKISLAEISRLSRLDQKEYVAREIRNYRKALADLRRNAVYYREFSSIENILLLGERYIRQMKRDLPPMVFLTSILCIKPGKLKDGFYPGLQDHHCYSAYNNVHLGQIGYEKEVPIDCRQDEDLIAGQPISMAFDYNANINWLVAGQRDGQNIRVLNSFYVKYNRKLRELVDDFCTYYRFHNCREVVYYYDTTALGSNYAVDKNDFASTICDQFAKHGWRVTRKMIGNPPRHSDKYHAIDQGFKGQGGFPEPMINEPHNEALLTAMRMAGVRIGPNGWGKDKSGEKYSESEEDRLEFRTDGTDAFDTLFWGMTYFPHRNYGAIPPMLTF